MSRLRQEFVAALSQTADRLDRVLSLRFDGAAEHELAYARDLMRSRRNELQHSGLPMYTNEAQTTSDLLDHLAAAMARHHNGDLATQVTSSVEPLRLMLRKYAERTDHGLRFPSEDAQERLDGPRLRIRR